MITLHRLGHNAEPFHLNPDLIITVEANPDTVVTLVSGTKIVVAEPAERVIAAIRSYRIDVLAGAMDKRRQEAPSVTGLAARRAAQGSLRAVDSDDEPRPTA